MNKSEYEKIVSYMRTQMDLSDPVHGEGHVHRVLKNALDIAEHCEAEIDRDVLIAACLLHDIGRLEENKRLESCHAQIGSEMACNYLLSIGWSEIKANHVSDAIKLHTHRKKTEDTPIEAQILFDADKLDTIGFIGIARLLMYDGIMGKPIYKFSEKKKVYRSADMSESSTFLQEYNLKKAIAKKLYTSYARNRAAMRVEKTINFYEGLLDEIAFYSSDIFH